jgi:hypothetical protein
MERVLEVYERPADPGHPVICFDEKSKQLIGEVRSPIPMKAGSPRRRDCEYKRRGTRNLFVMVDRHRGWRHAKLTRRRTRTDFAECMRDLVDRWYPKARRITVVSDNLNTHFAESLRRTFPAREARRILRRLELQHTPKHASWLNMAEIEIGVMGRQCLGRRIGEEERMIRELTAWEEVRNDEGIGIEWGFTRARAREKFARFYPSTPPG